MNTPAPPPSPESAPAGGERVAIRDYGLRMIRGTQIVPHGWTLTQDIATDPNTARAVRYRLDLRGPDGALIRGLGVGTYTQMIGTDLEQTWRGMVMQGLQQEVQDLALGSLQRSATLERLNGFQRAVQMGRQRGLEVRGLEAPLRGTAHGRPVEGMVYVLNFAGAQTPGVGSVQVTALISPPGRLAETLRLNEQIADSYRPDPQYEQRMHQINQMVQQRQQAQHQQRMAHSQALHQQRMADNQARFQAHQQMMQERYDASDRQHQQWMDDFRSSGSSAYAGSDYTGHEAFIDGIHERSTFEDPYSGQQVQHEGQYDHWYTNGLGDYYGTDDPAFNSNSLNGDWQPIEPRRPD